MRASVPIERLTDGPGVHWFGYYDKHQFDATGRWLLGMAADFEHRSPRPDDELRLGRIDRAAGNRWEEIGRTTAWCWQQGCMLQWRPGPRPEILWNDREDGRFVTRLLDPARGARRTLPVPVYALSPDGRTAVTTDFRRIQDMRPGYGYAGLPDPYRDDPAPAESGLWRVDLESGETELLLSLAAAAALPLTAGAFGEAKHYFNHLLVSPDGRRVEVLHRWRRAGETAFHTRMLTLGLDGSDLRVVDDSGCTSHFIWKDPRRLLAYTRPRGRPWSFYLFDDLTGECSEELAEPRNGHCTYLPGNEWILNDTYPQGEEREQILYLAHLPDGARVELGRFRSPAAYDGEWRCDLHPRASRDGRAVCIDSAHEGLGRQLYLLDIAAVVEARA
jgi:hypothetical protein